MTIEDEQPVYIPAGLAKRRYGNPSSTTWWRWENDETLGFPKPILISGRKFYKVTQLEDWEAGLPDGSAMQPPLPHKRRARQTGEPAATDSAATGKSSAKAGGRS